jgi:hypothetical protein
VAASDFLPAELVCMGRIRHRTDRPAGGDAPSFPLQARQHWLIRWPPRLTLGRIYRPDAEVPSWPADVTGICRTCRPVGRVPAVGVYRRTQVSHSGSPGEACRSAP